MSRPKSTLPLKRHLHLTMDGKVLDRLRAKVGNLSAWAQRVAVQTLKKP